MNDTTIMSGGQASANLARNFDCLVLRQFSEAPHGRSKVFAVHILHSEKGNAVGGANVEDATDVGMGNLAGDADFGVKPRKGGRILSERLRQKLDGDDLAQSEVFSAV